MSDQTPNTAADNPVYARLWPVAGVGLYALLVASGYSELNTLEGDLYAEALGSLLIFALLPFGFGGFLLVPSKGETSAGLLSKWTDADEAQRWLWFHRALFLVSGAMLVNRTWVGGVPLGDVVNLFLVLTLLMAAPSLPWPSLAAAK